MRIERVKESKFTKRKRLNDVPRFGRTNAWKQLKAEIDKGISPHTGIQMTLTEEDKQEYRIKNRRTITRFIEKYVKSKGLSYTVRGIRGLSGDVIRIANTPVERQIA